VRLAPPRRVKAGPIRGGCDPGDFLGTGIGTRPKHSQQQQHSSSSTLPQHPTRKTRRLGATAPRQPQRPQLAPGLWEKTPHCYGIIETLGRLVWDFTRARALSLARSRSAAQSASASASAECVCLRRSVCVRLRSLGPAAPRRFLVLDSPAAARCSLPAAMSRVRRAAE